jgi:mono/diheme cytochrome c family protein
MRRQFVAAVVSVFVGFFATSAQAQSAGSTPTFSKDVAPIFYANCTACHRPGDVAPMSLLTYKEARPWARSIATKVKDGSMPPWHADPAVGHFVNERRLTEAEKATIVKWATSGAPEGNATDLPPQPKYLEGWTIGQPDAVLSMQEDYPIPATGTVDYQYFEVPANFAEDRWIQAWELRPGNRQVVHHVIVNVRPPQPTEKQLEQMKAQALLMSLSGAPRPQPLFTLAEGMDIPPGQTGGRPLPADQQKPRGPNDRPRPRGVAGSIGGYVPGNTYRVFEPGTAIRLPKGSSLVFQMHYTPMGKETTDRSTLGLIFAKEPPKVPLSFSALINGSLHIPAGAANHRVDAEMTINRNVTLYSMVPHTHVRGTKWLYEAIYPDGRTETILSVPNYDFEWQHEYVFKEPLKLPAGTKIHAVAWYDNSKANKSNPDPTKDVWWGDQTWEEMMFTGLTFHAPPAPAPTTRREQ